MTRIPLSRRVILARQHAGLGRVELAVAVTDLSGKRMSALEIEALEEGGAKVSSRLVELAIACKVLPEWLVLAEGPMLAGDPPPEIVADSEALTDEERYIVRLWRFLPVDMKKPLRQLLQRLAQPANPDYQAYEANERRRMKTRNPGS